MKAMIDIALDIIEQASRIPQRYFREAFTIDHKDDESPVTIADRETEQFIRDALKKQFPEHAIFGEEFGREITDSEYEWIIDPIDGTKSFVTGVPLYGMLLALLKNQRPELGIVRMPELNEVYVGDGNTATRNRHELLQTSNTTDLKKAVVFINEGEKLSAENPALFARLCGSGRINRLGYDCYPHALLAAGKIDLVVDFDLKPYDYLPLIPIIEGAGGVITDWQGKALNLQSEGRVISAANARLHQQGLGLLENS